MPPLPSGEEQRRQKAFLRKIEWIVLAIFLVGALVVYANIQRVVVQGRSMEPTLHDGDALIAWKTIRRENLSAGDVVVFRDVDGAELIKRIVFVQNAQGTATPPGDVPTPTGPRPFRVLFRDYNMAVRSGRRPPPDPANTIYVLGDNTDNSEDSRVFGPIRPDQIIGQVYGKDLGSP